jgi:hypothetical protein
MNKKFYFFIFLFYFFSCDAVTAQTGKAFSGKAVYEQVPDKYSNYDAVLIFEKRNVSLTPDFNSGQLKTSIKKHSKIKIITKRGIQDYARVVVPKIQGQKLERMSVRTIKQSGAVVDLQQSDIKELEISGDDNIYDKRKFILFSIPGVETGDEIEIVTEYFGNSLITCDDVFLDSFVPSMRTSYKLMIESSLKTEIKTYNGMPDPLITHPDTYNAYEWELKDVPTYNDQTNSIRSFEAPYIRFAIRSFDYLTYHFPVEENTWISYTDAITAMTDTKLFSWRSVDGFLEEKTGKHSQASAPENKLANLVKLHRFIVDSMNVGWLSADISEKSLMYHINKRKINDRNLILLYDKIFNYLDIDYYVGFGRGRYEGVFDDEFISSNQITHLFLSFELQGTFYFIFLKDEYASYELGEIPTDLQGTKTIMIAQKKSDDRVKQAKMTEINKMNNFRRVKNLMDVKLDEGSIKGNSKETFSGSISTDKKSNFAGLNKTQLKEYKTDLLKKQNDNVIIDTIGFDRSDTYKFPYTCNLSYSYHFKEANITNLDKNLYSIQLNNWIDHFAVRPNTSDRTADFHTEYLYTDNIKFYLVFDHKIELKNKENIETTVANSYGSYTLSVKQINENSLLIDSNFDVNKYRLTKDEYGLLKQLYEAYQKANTNQLVIKTLD